MSISVQIYSLLLNFIFGFGIIILLLLNNYLFFNSPKIIKMFTFTLLTLILEILYLMLNYQINNGCYHLYFLILFVIGILFGIETINLCKRLVNGHKAP